MCDIFNNPGTLTPAISGSISLDDPLQAKINAYYRRLCLVNEGVLYEDGTLQIGIKTEFSREMGRLMFYYGNSSMSPLSSFQTAFISVQNLQIQAQPIVNVIAPKAQIQQLVNVVCTGEISESPTLQISFVYVIY